MTEREEQLFRHKGRSGVSGERHALIFGMDLVTELRKHAAVVRRDDDWSADLLEDGASEIERFVNERDEAERLVSIVHDRIWDKVFDRKAASDAVWDVHRALRKWMNEPDTQKASKGGRPM